MYDLSNKTLSQIVTDHYQTARVFEKYRLDFCCKGKRSLLSACEEIQVPFETILEDLSEVISQTDEKSEFDKMSLTELSAYIVRVHHTYVKLNAPQILNYCLKVATKHGDRFPYMKEVYLLFSELVEELTAHMAKEETVLFPRIVLLELNAPENTGTPFLDGPIEVMKHEHDEAGAILQNIRRLTNDYQAPDQACTTFRLALDSLKAFEEDLHKHVHLENNILFPKAVQAFSRPNACSINR
jgi:regulator of cell morphogenesis and NO signaling